MLSETFITLVDNENPFNEMRFSIKGFKCLKTGSIGKKINDCKFSNHTDDLIFKLQDKEAYNYFNK